MKQLSRYAHAAKLIRQELKKEFPKIKFSVTSKSYSGGDSVSIDWNDGPTCKEVEEITSKYQSGSFNGMEDIYEYNNTNENLPQTKYVMEHRTFSKEIINQAFEYIRYTWKCLEGKNVDDSSTEINHQLGTWTAANFLYRTLQHINLTNGLTKEMLENVIFNR